MSDFKQFNSFDEFISFVNKLAESHENKNTQYLMSKVVSKNYPEYYQQTLKSLYLS